MWGAEPQPARTRPKVGLVLAGGGALGLAHVGVIRWLEEHRIPVDYVTGTSMGGLVGGLYATGHDAKSMEEFVEAIDWPVALQVNTPFPDLSFRRKEDRREFPNALEFGLKNGFNLPSGLSAGHGVGLVLTTACTSSSTGNGSTVGPRRRHSSRCSGMSGGTTAGRTETGLPPFTLSGPLLLSALAPYQLLGDE